MLESVRIKSESKVIIFLIFLLKIYCIVECFAAFVHSRPQAHIYRSSWSTFTLNLGPKSCADSVNYRSQIKLARPMDPT